MKLAVNNYDDDTVGFLEGEKADQLLMDIIKSNEDFEPFLTETRRDYFLNYEVNKHLVLNEQFFDTVHPRGIHVDSRLDIYLLK